MRYLRPLALVALVFAVYANSLHGLFVFDDQAVVMVPQVLGVTTVAAVLHPGMSGYRQLLYMTYGLNYYLGGVNPFGYHVVNVALHALNVLLVYVILLQLAAAWPSWAGAALFAVHPIFTGAVSYIAGRSSLLCGTFYFLAVLCFLMALPGPWTRRIGYGSLAALSAFLAWQTKQEAITLPLLLAFIALQRYGFRSWRALAFLSAIPIGALIALRESIVELYRITGENRQLLAAGFDHVLPFGVYLPTYITALISYILPRFVIPVHLSIDPDIPIATVGSLEFLGSMLILSLLFYFMGRYLRSQRLFSLGLAALLISPLLAYTVISLADVVQEHRLYIPGLGIAVLGAWVTGTLWHARARWPILLGIAACGILTVQRNAVWAGPIAIWEDAVRQAPQKARPRFNLGQAYQEQGRFAEAALQYRTILAINPNIHAAYSNLAAIYLDSGQLAQGELLLLRVTAMAPDFVEGWVNLGVLYLRTGQTDKAIDALQHALKITPDNMGARFNIAEAWKQKGDLDAALANYREAVRLRPDLEAFKIALRATEALHP